MTYRHSKILEGSGAAMMCGGGDCSSDWWTRRRGDTGTREVNNGKEEEEEEVRDERNNMDWDMAGGVVVRAMIGARASMLRGGVC